MNVRAVAYSAVLLILLALTGYLLKVRGEVETTIIRAQGSMYQEYGENRYKTMLKIFSEYA